MRILLLSAEQGFQSTLPLRGATAWYIKHASHVLISIHAPLTGSDPSLWPGSSVGSHFNPRSPYGERHAVIATFFNSVAFQSTLPLRGATAGYPFRLLQKAISIHAPLTGSDRCRSFNGEPCYISIHAPLTGSDRTGFTGCKRTSYFNPRSPYGERLFFSSLDSSVQRFQSTLPLRGATFRGFLCLDCHPISIHAPLTGSDQR